MLAHCANGLTFASVLKGVFRKERTDPAPSGNWNRSHEAAPLKALEEIARRRFGAKAFLVGFQLENATPSARKERRLWRRKIPQVAIGVTG